MHRGAAGHIRLGPPTPALTPHAGTSPPSSTRRHAGVIDPRETVDAPPVAFLLVPGDATGSLASRPLVHGRPMRLEPHERHAVPARVSDSLGGDDHDASNAYSVGVRAPVAYGRSKHGPAGIVRRDDMPPAVDRWFRRRCRSAPGRRPGGAPRQQAHPGCPWATRRGDRLRQVGRCRRRRRAGLPSKRQADGRSSRRADPSSQSGSIGEIGRGAATACAEPPRSSLRHVLREAGRRYPYQTRPTPAARTGSVARSCALMSRNR